jgi:C4-dicarboxylate transporter, DctM subunit
MNPVHAGILGIVILIVILFSKFPVAFCMALVGLLGFAYLVSPAAALNIIAKDFYSVFSSYDLTVVPLFVFMGQILFYAGISRKLYDAAHAWLGHHKGGLAMATVWVPAHAFRPSVARRTPPLPQWQPSPCRK